MSLDVYIKFKKRRKENYFLTHPYSYDHLSKADEENYTDEEEWWTNITHNLGTMADHIPIKDVIAKIANVTLYDVCWHPEYVWEHPTTDLLLPCLIEGISYMVAHRKELLQYESENGWGTYNGFMKFLLNYKQACEDNQNCLIEASR